MATSRLSLTFFLPMNSRSRCGRSFSSNDESSSTGTAETMRSGWALSLGKGTQGDSKANVGGGANKCALVTKAAVLIAQNPFASTDASELPSAYGEGEEVRARRSRTHPRR